MDCILETLKKSSYVSKDKIHFLFWCPRQNCPLNIPGQC